jgi:hypothetical protein
LVLICDGENGDRRNTVILMRWGKLALEDGIIP